jgi:hypothetical protein
MSRGGNGGEKSGDEVDARTMKQDRGSLCGVGWRRRENMRWRVVQVIVEYRMPLLSASLVLDEKFGDECRGQTNPTDK